MFLSAYENDSWRTADLDWVEDRQDGAVELIATRADGTTLAIEHTLIQPFVGEKDDTQTFMKALEPIEKNPALVRPGRQLTVLVPVYSIPRHYNRCMDQVRIELENWLRGIEAKLPDEGEESYRVTVARQSKCGPLQLTVKLRMMSTPGMPGSCTIGRIGPPSNFGDVVEKALETKASKLAKTMADRRLLLLEREQFLFGAQQIYDEIEKQAAKFPCLSQIDEIWHVNTAMLESNGYACFELIDERRLVECLTFKDGLLESRWDDRPFLPPPRRG
jgi:hypothetical protein